MFIKLWPWFFYVEVFSFLRIAYCVWGQKEREELCKLVSRKKKRGAFKPFLAKPAKQALERSGLFLRKERDNLWDSFPSSLWTRRMEICHKQQNKLRKTGVWRHRYSEERQHHDSFSHVQRQVGKPASPSPSTGFWYVLLRGREGKKQHWVSGTQSLTKLEEKYGERHQWNDCFRNSLVSSFQKGKLQFRLWF